MQTDFVMTSYLPLFCNQGTESFVFGYTKYLALMCVVTCFIDSLNNLQIMCLRNNIFADESMAACTMI